MPDTIKSDHYVQRVADAFAAATIPINSDSVDMTNLHGVAFVVSMGAITAGAVTSIKLEVSDDDSSWQDVEGSGMTILDTQDNVTFVNEVGRLGFKFIRCVVLRATQNSALDGILAIGNVSSFKPHDQDDGVVSQYLLSPLVGTP